MSWLLRTTWGNSGCDWSGKMRCAKKFFQVSLYACLFVNLKRWFPLYTALVDIVSALSMPQPLVVLVMMHYHYPIQIRVGIE